MQTMGYDPEVAQTRSHVKNLTCSTRRLGAPAGPDSAFRGNLSLQKTGQGFYHIRRGEAILAPGCGTMVSRRPMDPGGTGGSLQRRQALCQKGNQEPRQYIAAAACGHAGIAGVIFIPPGSVGHHRLVTLQEHPLPGGGTLHRGA